MAGWNNGWVEIGEVNHLCCHVWLISHSNLLYCTGSTGPRDILWSFALGNREEIETWQGKSRHITHRVKHHMNLHFHKHPNWTVWCLHCMAWWEAASDVLGPIIIPRWPLLSAAVGHMNSMNLAPYCHIYMAGIQTDQTWGDGNDRTQAFLILTE